MSFYDNEMKTFYFYTSQEGNVIHWHWVDYNIEHDDVNLFVLGGLAQFYDIVVLGHL